MSQQVLASGGFASLKSIHPETAALMGEVPTTWKKFLGKGGAASVWGMERVSDANDPSLRFVAISNSSRPHSVIVFDIDTKNRVSEYKHHRSTARALACIPGKSGQPPLLLHGSGRELRGAHLVFTNALTGRIESGFTYRNDLDPFNFSKALYVPEFHENSVYCAHPVRAGVPLPPKPGGQEPYCVTEIGFAEASRTRSACQGSVPDFDYGAAPPKTLHQATIMGLAASVSRGLLLSSGFDGTARAFDWKSHNPDECAMTIRLSGAANECYMADDKNMLLVAIFQPGGVEMYDVRRHTEPLAIVHPLGEGTTTYAIERMGENRFVCCGGRELAVFDVLNGDGGADMVQVVGKYHCEDGNLMDLVSFPGFVGVRDAELDMDPVQEEG